MRRISPSALVFTQALALAVLTRPAAAQNDVVPGPNGLPKKFVTSEDNEPMPVIVVAEGARVLAEPKRTGKTIRNAKFLEAYQKVDEAEEPGTGLKYVLAATGIGDKPDKLVGWFAEADVLQSKRALKEIPGIFLKGLIINQWQTAKSEKGIDIKGASVLNGPGKRATSAGTPFTELQQLRLFQFFFIYKKYDSPDGQKFVLLGDSPIILNSLEANKTLLGWVDSKRVHEWSTRESVEFDKTTLEERVKAGGGDEKAGVQIFASKEELEAHLEGLEKLGDVKIEPVSIEDTKVKRWEPYLQRFPLFKSIKSDKLKGVGDLMNVGYIGDQIFVDSGAHGPDPTQTAQNQARLEQMRRDLNNIDLLFVIDATGSMEPYFKSAADAVKMITSLIEAKYPAGSEGRPSIQYSVLFYRDYCDEDGKDGDGNPKDTYLVKRLPLTGNVDLVAKYLDDEPTPPDGAGGDEPEAVFYAIDQAIASAAKDPIREKGYRALILLGDAGNHPDDERGYTTAKIAERIKEANYDFYAIPAVNEAKLRTSVAAQLFRDQTDEITRKVHESGNVRHEAFHDPREVAAAIVAAFTQTLDVKEGVDEGAKLLSRGATLQEIDKKYGVRVTEKLSKEMAKAGIDPALFVKERVQIFDKGWTSSRDPASGKNQIKLVMLVERVTLLQELAILASLSKTPPSRQSIQQVWEKVLKDAIGEGQYDQNKTYAEMIQAHTGLPVRSKMLQKTPITISQMNEKELQESYQDLLYDLACGQGIYTEKNLDIKRGADASGAFKLDVKELGTRQVWWRDRGVEWGWIPAEELP
jgi:hypothetical protein